MRMHAYAPQPAKHSEKESMPKLARKAKKWCLVVTSQPKIRKKNEGMR